MDLLSEVPAKGEKLILDRLYHYLREKYDPMIKVANQDFKGERLHSELRILKENEQLETVELQEKLKKYFEKVVSSIQNRRPFISFKFQKKEKGGSEELMFTIFISIMELKGYGIELIDGVDTDRFMDYYEPYTIYKISLV